MHKKLHEKIRDHFINLGKKYKILLPVAVIGLFITLLFTKMFHYIASASKRFACAAFVICCFFIGSSFAFPIFNPDNGFVTDGSEETMIAAANDSNLNFAPEDEIESAAAEETDTENVAIKDESGVLLDEDLVYLDDMLKDLPESEEEEPKPVETAAPTFDPFDWRLTLINKQHPIPDGYEFVLGDLSGSMKCDERIINDLLTMVKAAMDDGVKLVICSPYRDLERQEMLFNRKIDAYMKKGYSYMDAYKLSSQAVTIPGSSEHQVGLAIDIVTDYYTYLDDGFADTDAGKWLAEHCDEYGFILRYPKDKEYITGIEFEPWHFRYVGKQAAKLIMDSGICLEEFWEKYL
ncbi:MAG: M15 family metallopeptidase [Lachnospiraceae bacterium]|nr:M15 family metallopeptidase [Lachnospiraceae bacterium]